MLPSKKPQSAEISQAEHRAPLILFVFGLVFFAFLFGFVAGFKKLPPYGIIRTAYLSAIDLSRHWKNDLNIEPTRLLVPAMDNRSPVRVLDANAAAKGDRFISGLTHGRSSLTGALLLTLEGKELHYWPIDYSKLDPEGPDPENTFLHGIEVFEDGSVIVNFDVGNVLAKLGPCGQIHWVVKGGFHHVVSRSYDGTVWTLKGQNLIQVNVDSGEAVRSISLFEDVAARHGLQGIFAIRTDENEDGLVYLKDPYHSNDIDILPPSLASAFPMFEVGDILVSLRSLNLVGVIGATDHELKWWSIGPWHRQHDPDFLPDGSISVYNNNMNFGSSEIVKIDPQTGEHQVLIRGGDRLEFYSWRRGKHENLSNGNILVTESERGRVFEVDGNGTVVWEFQNVFDETRNGVVNKAMVLPEQFFEPDVLRCGGTK